MIILTILLALLFILPIIAIVGILMNTRSGNMPPAQHAYPLRKTKFLRLPFLAPPIGGYVDPRSKFGSWLYGDWYLGERVDKAITEGKEEYAHGHARRGHVQRQKRQHKHH